MTDKKSEFIEQLFNAISSDPALPAELKISLLRLQLPINNLCHSDPCFITNTRHPARQTLILVKQLSILSKNDPLIIKKINFLLSELFTSSPGSRKFAQINLQLDKAISMISKKQATGISSDKKTKIQLKELLSHKIKHCIEGHTIPSACQNIVLKLWPGALFYLLKTHGDKSPQWVNAINMYSDLLDFIQPISNSAQHARIKDHFMNIVRSNNNMLLLYHQERIVEPEIKSLITHFNKLLKSSQFSNMQRELDTKKTDHTENKLLNISSTIKPGIWCEIYINEITPSRRLKLSLINTKTGMLIFVNRKGIKKLEKDAMEFSEELEKGLSKIYKHDALFTKPSTKPQYQKIG
ncbi:MAG: DUF1631 domain-containing protein [Gammaproteobacteria bacterium]|nr:DUF1631 domain-containing protein [Gammaproteobacteria bacterium]